MAEIIRKAPVLPEKQMVKLTITDLDLNLKSNIDQYALIRRGALAQRDADHRYYLREFVEWLKNHLMGHSCENLRGQKVTEKVLMEGDWQALLRQVQISEIPSEIPDVMSEKEYLRYIKKKLPKWIEEMREEVRREKGEK